MISISVAPSVRPTFRSASRRSAAFAPEVELHAHLEGCITPATAPALARRHRLNAARLGLVWGRYPDRFEDLAHFIRVYLAVCRLIRTPDDLLLVAAAFARQQADQGVL